ncbi:hypothetical protein COO60DRAFT_1500676, partial [Scenedesmus sp. NREL 46B-D3]
MLGGKPHSASLPSGQRKLKRHLIQDLLAYHQHVTVRSRSSGADGGRHTSSFSASPDDACSISCALLGAPGAAGASAGTAWLHAKPSSSGSAQEAALDLCAPDTAKAAAGAAAAAAAGSADGAGGDSRTPRGSRQQTPRTPRSFGLGSGLGIGKGAAAAAASPAAGSGLWGWLTPRSSKKKQKAVAPAAPGGSSDGLAVHMDCTRPGYGCDIAASRAAGADTMQHQAGSAAVAEGVVSDSRAAASSLAGTGSRSAVERLMLQMQSDPKLASPGPAVPLDALMAAGYGGAADSSTAGDVRVLQQEAHQLTATAGGTRRPAQQQELVGD